MASPLTVAGHLGGESSNRLSIAVRWLDGKLYPVELWRRYLLVFFAATLSCTVILKVADIQYLEVIFALDFLLVLIALVSGGFKFRVFAPFLEIARAYGIFMVATFALSLVALQQDFSAPHLTFLKSPVIVTIARIAEIFLDAFYTLYLASLFREDEALCRFGARTYFWTGIAGCLYSFLSYPINVATGLQLGAYLDTHRLRGFNNEGGGFGLYLLSVMVLAVVTYRMRWISKRLLLMGTLVFSLALVGSASKSAFLALGMLGGITLAWFLQGWRRWTMFVVLALGMMVLGSIFDIQGQIDMYRKGSARYQELSNIKAGDGNFVMGRVAGAVIAPRMIAARPLTGIGWGNYPLVRDNPEYRHGTAFEIGTFDAPSLGVIDYIVELGIPLWLYLVWIELKPVLMLRRVHADIWLVALALIQPVSNWAGAHLNLTHPWIMVAFALGLAYRQFSPTSPNPRQQAGPSDV
jgi:hypothetical protein